MCEDLPVPRLSPVASPVVSLSPLVAISPVPGTLSSLWSSMMVEIGRYTIVEEKDA